MSEPVPVKLAIQIRWRDLDALGHVNNAVYLTYFELARLAYIRALLGEDAPRDPRTLLPIEFQFILAEVTCHYRSPATLGDQLMATIWVSAGGAEKLRVRVPDHDEVTGRLVAEGCSTQVWFDYAAGESRPVPAEIVARMEGLQGAPIARV